eukprot:TRINITY_DN184_c0_g1_i6.p3 TRINITY_DN184_c0_g1~~TRINITY_DN184_c0_g1_i6.p3  ORF type:complete len:148 (+),score=3.04 TRINITY_DN184_c0_g1_i6:725-1168(+)
MRIQLQALSSPQGLEGMGGSLLTHSDGRIQLNKRSERNLWCSRLNKLFVGAKLLERLCLETLARMIFTNDIKLPNGPQIHHSWELDVISMLQQLSPFRVCGPTYIFRPTHLALILGMGLTGRSHLRWLVAVSLSTRKNALLKKKKEY